jgi:hypothetical protein
VLGVQEGAGNGDEGVAAGGRLGKLWRGRRRAAGEGNRTGAGGDGRVEVISAGGGAAAAARGEVLHRRQEAEQSSTSSRKKK